MAPTPDTRKPLAALTAEDLRVFPIWAFVTDAEDAPGQDETWVSPVLSPTVPRGMPGVSVAVDVVAADGTAWVGVADVPSGLLRFFPSVSLLVGGQCVLLEGRPGSATRRRQLRALGLAEKALYPLRFTCRARVDGERRPRTGTLR